MLQWQAVELELDQSRRIDLIFVEAAANRKSIAASSARNRSATEFFKKYGLASSAGRWGNEGCSFAKVGMGLLIVR